MIWFFIKNIFALIDSTSLYIDQTKVEPGRSLLHLGLFISGAILIIIAFFLDLITMVFSWIIRIIRRAIM